MATDTLLLGPVPLALRPLLVTVLVLLALERGLELVVDRRHRRRLAARDARLHADDGFLLILTAQASLFVLPATEALLAPWRGGLGPWTVVGILGLVVAQGIRYWVIRTLGDRWTLRVITLPAAPRVQAGPYRFLPHPNYLAVFLEAVALPLAFGAWGSLALVPLVHAVALTRRIQAEEDALAGAPA